MIWRKYGKIFSPEEYGFLYAKSPQAIVFDEFVRIYFSDCKHDGKKLISYVCYVDFSLDFKKILRTEKQIINDGNLGCFDEHGIFPFSPVKVEDKIYAYTSGWSRRVSVSVETGIGLAKSEDNGNTFVRVGEGPVLASSISEPFLVVDGFVRRFNNQFHMWYIYGKKWKKFQESEEPERIYKIGHATSENGIDWSREGKEIISSVLPDESQALPCVIYADGKYRMIFCYRYSVDFRRNPKRGYRLGYAESFDMKIWERKDEVLNFEPDESNWANQMLCYPNMFLIGNEVYLLYNGNEFGKTGIGLAKLEEW